MKRLKGPELKMPELKAPGFLADFYYDLRDRRLLPVLALVLVAIVATPILLGQKSETTLPPAASEAIQALGESQGPKAASFTVVEAQPGLRDYHKRLRNRKPLDPFRSMGKPNLEGARLGGGEGGGEEASSSGAGSASFTSTSTTTKETKNSKTTTTKTTTTTGSGEGSEGGSGAAGGPGAGKGGSGGGSAPPKHATLFSFAVDVTITHGKVGKGVGEQQTDKPEKLTKVLPTTSLPDSTTQVVTYMGLSPKTRKPLFIVSPEVTSVFGEGKCASGLGACQLVELEPGFPETFEFESGDQYSIKVTKIEYVVVGHS
jgi:hypothetical protein